VIRLSVDFEKNFINEQVELLEGEFKVDALKYREIMMTYYAAIKQVQTKLEILNDELQVTSKRNPIEFIKVRLKSQQSIIRKMRRFGIEQSIDNLTQISDIAGVRVVCSYIDDLYDVAHMFVKQDDVKLIQIQDYIKKPKENGYRSLHLLVEIPVFFANVKRSIKVEIQIRTIAMDFWGQLEHDMEYKHVKEATTEIKEELKACADIIHETDIRMQKIKQKLRGME
jgi:putative GTP pyrophosphokinase